jgi:hypothetical protein
MFDKVTEQSHNYLQAQIDTLKKTCEKDPGVAEMVRYIVAYSDQMAYCDGDEDARIGRQIIQQIWQISKLDLSGMGNSVHFDPSWAAELNNFIGNYIYDDSGFDFDVCTHSGTLDFKPAGYDAGRWLQDPWVIVQAAKANRAYYKKMDESDIFSRMRDKADISKVLELVK